jgi:excinuclease ABC subunit C
MTQPRRSDVQGLFRREAFTGFGPSALECVRAELTTVRARGPRRLRRAMRQHCPRLPGVYGMLDSSGELIYVGKARSLRARLLSYFRPSRDEKAGKIIDEARALVWEQTPDEFAAVLRELELIRRHQPRFNVAGQPRRQRRCYLCLGRPPAPYAYVVTKPPSKALAVYGPLPGVRQARESARRLCDWYRLRDCPQKQVMVFADQRELFPVLHTPGCLRHDIGNCLAPCAAACTQPEYAFHVEAARDFLDGKDRSPLDILERDMNESSAAQEYERAAVLRDRLDSLDWLWRHLERLRQAVRYSFVYPVTGQGSATWYLIRHGLVRAALPAPTCEASRGQALEKLDSVFTTRSALGVPAFDEVDGVLLVAGWFARHRSEKERALEVPACRELLARRAELTAVGQ